MIDGKDPLDAARRNINFLTTCREKHPLKLNISDKKKVKLNYKLRIGESGGRCASIRVPPLKSLPGEYLSYQ